MHYRSPLAILGIPLLHVAMGPQPGAESRRGIAVGWIAVGDVAIGILVGIGGVSVGALSLGGVSVGGLALAGLSLGVWSVGGLAVGVFAFGGAAIGLSAALGGLAIAVEYAAGGTAIASHANDAAARAYFESGGFYAITERTMRYLDWVIALTVGLAALLWVFARKDGNHSSSA